MKKNCISVKCGSVGLLGNGYAEIEANLFGFSQKGLNGIKRHYFMEEVASIVSEQPAEIKDQ